METGSATLSFAREDLAGSHGFDFAPIRPDAPPVGIEICLICDDVPAAFAHAVGHGAVALAPPLVKPWGQVVAFLRDCNGALVEIATPVGA
jgi:catechol 2,3-dioxygenase-like lactoylglutathione lyase family enzyme